MDKVSLISVGVCCVTLMAVAITLPAMYMQMQHANNMMQIRMSGIKVSVLYIHIKII